MSAYRLPIAPAPLRRRARLLAGCALAAAAGHPALAQTAFQATGTVAQGNASISQGQSIPGGLRDRVQVFSSQAVIDWVPTDTATGGGAIEILAQPNELSFVGNPSNLPNGYTVLNRIVPNDASRAIRFEGLVSSAFDNGYGATSPGGSVWFYSPGGIIAGANSRFDVGSLVLTANPIDTSGGLFADADLDAQRGRIIFRAAQNSAGFVTVESGAQINAAGSYVALVAPRVSQGGRIDVNGSAALIAGESVDLRIPVAGGLFDIFVYDQARADAPAGTIFEHSGTTRVSASSGAGDNRRVYMVAVPKNDAVTMLVSGTIGYQAATQVDLDNGRIILTTGTGVSDQDVVYENGAGRTAIAGGTFNADVTAFGGESVTLDTSLSDAGFVRNATLLTGTGTGGITIAASGGRTIQADGTLLALLPRQSTTSTITMTAGAGSTIRAGTIRLDGRQFDESGYGGPAQGRIVSLSANGGIIQAIDAIEILAAGQGGGGQGGGGFINGGSGQGGSIALSASAGGSINTGLLTLNADGLGGESGYGVGGTGGAGTGGGITFSASGGATITADAIAASARGRGGYGDVASGAGTGGAVTLNIVDSGLSSGSLAISVLGFSADQSEMGYGRTAIGGGGTGGIATLVFGNANASPGILGIDADGRSAGGASESAAATGGTVALAFDGGTAELTSLTIGANGLGGGATSGGLPSPDASGQSGFTAAPNATATPNGGNGSGGGVTVTLASGTMLSTGSIAIAANGIGGYAQQASGNGAGGTVSFGVTGSSLSTTSLGIDAAGLSVAIDPTNSSNFTDAGGAGTGGIVTLGFTDATTALGDATVNVSGGAAGGNLSASDGSGGTASFSASGGSLSFDALTLVALGNGGGAGFFGSDVPVGGTGTGGTIAMTLGNITLSGAADMSAFADAAAGSGEDGGAATGGSIALTANTGAVLPAGDGLLLSANATGGSGQDLGRTATGGTVTVTANGGTINGGNGSVRARAFGGDASGGRPDQFTTVPTAGGIAGPAGAAVGGTVTIVARSGGTVNLSGEVLADAQGGEGFGGSRGGDATGGSIALTADGGTIDFTGGAIDVVASGSAGASRPTDGVATGRGGSIAVQVSGDGGAMRFGTLALVADGGIAVSENDPTADGNGGTGVGGTVSVAVNGGAMSGDGLSLTATGTGGLGRNGGKGGTGYQGRAIVSVSGGSMILTEDLTLRAETFGGTSYAETGYGEGGDGGDAGIGTNPFGADAGAYVILSGGLLRTPGLRVSADAFGADGGDSFGDLNAGAGGWAVGGIALVSASGSSLAEIGNATVSADARGGEGGNGAFDGELYTSPGATGGEAYGGWATFASTGGRATLTATTLRADATAGAGGVGETGPGQFGRAAAGSASGGSVTLTAADGLQTALLDMGDLTLSANASGRANAHVAGQVTIASSGTDAGGAIRFTMLTAEALGSNAGPNPGIQITANNGSIAGTGFTRLEATAGIRLDATGAGGLRTTGNVFVLSETGGITLTHAAPTAATLAGGAIQFADAVFVDAAPTTRIAANGDILVRAEQSIALGSLTGGNAVIENGYGGTGLDIVLAGDAQLSGGLAISSVRDAVIDTGAQVVVDRNVRIVTGDDIIVRTGALLRAANNPPPESGYGASDPKQQMSQMQLSAGFNGDATPGNVASLIVDGAIEAPARTMQLEAGAIQGSAASRLVAGNLYVRITDRPEGAPSDDFGQLAAPCLQGNVCLGDVNAAGVVRIGESGFEPLTLRLNGGIDATDVSLLARGDILLGLAGTSRTIRGADSLDIFAGGNIVGNGPVAIFGGTDLASIAAGGRIDGASIDVTALGLLNMYAPGDIVLNAVTARQLQTLTPQGADLNASGITTAGLIRLGALNVASDTVIEGGAGVVLDSATLASNALAVRSGGDVTMGSILAGSIAADTPGALTFASLQSTTGAIALGGTARPATITGGSASAAGDLTVRATGSITGDALAAGNGLLVDSAGGSIDLATATANGTATLIAGSSTILVRQNATTGGALTATARAIDLTGATGLTIASATATDGDLRLRTIAGDMTIGIGSASGDAVLSSGGALRFTALTAGGATSATAAGPIEGGTLSSGGLAKLVSANGAVTIGDVASVPNGVVASGTAVTLAATGALNVVQAVASVGDVTLSARGGSLTVGQARAAGRTLLSSDGAVTLADGRGPVSATGRSLNLASLATLDVDAATATGSDAVLTGANGVIFRAVQASGTATITATQADVIGTRVAATTLGVSAPGLVRIDDVAVPGGVTATGGSVALTGPGGLNIVSARATAGDLSLTTRGGNLNAGISSASGAMTLTAADTLAFDTLTAGGALTATAQGAITGGDATAGTIAITTPATIVADDLIATAGPLSVIADRGITLDEAVSTGTTTLRAVKGAIRVASDIRAGQGLIIAAPSVDLTGRNGLFIVSADATAGDLRLRTTAGDLIAGSSSATGAMTIDSAGALSFDTLTARQGIALTATGAIDGRSTSSAGLVANGTRGVVIDRIASTGAVTLGASAGAIRVASDITAGGPIQATAQALSLNAIGDLTLSQGTATAGDLMLTSGGALTVGQANASGALIGTTPGLLTVNGSASGGTIAFTSLDLSIGEAGRIGSVTQTDTLTLTSIADRTFIGGGDTGGFYRLSQAEVARIAARRGIRIVGAPQSQQSTAFTFTDPANAMMVMDALTFDGAQLGPSGSFTIESPRSIGAVGFAQFRNFTDGQSVLLNAATDISLSAENGLLTLKNAAGGLAGTLELRAQQVTAMTAAARRDVPNLTLNEVRQRLGDPDGVQNEGGFAQAGNIIVRVGRLFFVQNSGGPAIEQRRGFTAARNLTIEATGREPIQIVINGRIGDAVGADLAPAIRFVGPFDPASTFSNCTFGDGACGAAIPEPTPLPTPNIIFAAARDQIESEEDEDEKEEALKAAQTRPDPVIQIAGAPKSRFEPLIDEPITGAGNEDLWESPPPPLSPTP